MSENNNNSTTPQDYLSKKTCDCLKGIFAVCVLLHHLFQHSGLFHGTLIGIGLQFLGYFSVGVYFFLSGFGLMQSFQAKGKVYLDIFPKKRILPFYITIVFLTILYSLYQMLLGDGLEISLMIKSLLFGGTVIANGWYLQVQLFCYITFYFVFQFCRIRSCGMALITVLTLCFILGMAVFGFAHTWYVSVPLFVLGLWFSCSKNRFDQFIRNRKNWLILLLTSGLTFVISMLCCKFANITFISEVSITLAECAFVFCVLLIVNKVNIDCSLTRKLGVISLEIYVMQGICLSFFHSYFWNIKNPYWYVIVASMGTVLLALAIHPLIKMIFSSCGGNRGEPKRYKHDTFSK